MALHRLLFWLLLLGSLPLRAELAVTDDSGRELQLARPAQRIISLAPHITEQLYAVGSGAELVGAVEYSDYPEAAKRLPRVGGYSRLDLEAILALRPDLVVGWLSGNDNRQLERLEQLGIPVYRSEPRELADIASGLRRLGILSGHREEAAARADGFEQTLAQLRAAHHGQRPVRVFYQIWNRPLMTINGAHLISDVIRLCGGENVFAGLPALTPVVSEEAVIAVDPDIIIASGMGEARPEWLDEWRRWQGLRAVRNGRLRFIPPDLLQRATPRLLQGAERLCRMLEQARAEQ
jgi:iron complex transport system substrate-binding protein